MFLFRAREALGDMLRLKKGVFNCMYNCFFKVFQERACFFVLCRGDGCELMTGPLGVNNGRDDSTLLYNEYVVYDTNQVKLRYLVKVQPVYEPVCVLVDICASFRSNSNSWIVWKKMIFQKKNELRVCVWQS